MAYVEMQQIDLKGPVGDWLVRALGKGVKPVRGERLICGPASPAHLVEVERRGRRERYVLRLFVDQDWLAREPDLAEHEAAALRQAASHGLPAPGVVDFCPDGSACGFPAVLMTFLDGAVNLAPGGLDNRLAETARMLARIHSVPAVDFPWRYFSFTNEETLSPPSWSKRPGLWEEAIRIRLAGPPENSDVFLHRDYHPVNLLWEGAGLSGVVDWVNACAGPAGVDVAHCRTNLVLMYGVSVAERFRQAYFEAGDAASLQFGLDIEVIVVPFGAISGQRILSADRRD